MSKELPNREAVVSFKQAKSCATRASDKLMRQARDKTKEETKRSTDNIHDETSNSTSTTRHINCTETQTNKLTMY